MAIYLVSNQFPMSIYLVSNQFPMSQCMVSKLSLMSELRNFLYFNFFVLFNQSAKIINFAQHVKINPAFNTRICYTNIPSVIFFSRTNIKRFQSYPSFLSFRVSLPFHPCLYSLSFFILLYHSSLLSSYSSLLFPPSISWIFPSNPSRFIWLCILLFI